MIKFLLQRPIAVLMAFTACFIIGLVTYFTIPVSLLPDIAIPEITVQVTGQNTSARELENTVVKPIRLQLMQVAGLKDIHSETRDGAGIVRLNFDFGTNTDLAFIEVNEKIDAAMNYLPKEVERPRVIKASATDIPVFYLNLTLKSDKGQENEAAFLDLCQFAETVIKRRIEQLPEVAMVDITGMLKRQVQIVPDMKLLEMANITLNELETALNSNNIEPGSMIVRDGYYEYNIKFSTLLRTPEDVQNIYIRKNGRIFQLKDIARIAIVPEKETGLSLAGNKRAVTLAIIKQSDENMDNMKEALNEVTDYFASVYPDIEFSVTRNQTELLDYTISNLKQNLSLGFLFICIVAILFLGDVKSPAVIGLSMVVSIIISFLFFYLCNMSLNIISLSGLILALGMMIDSSIIVTENIVQYRAKGFSLEDACIKGTSEVITPMLSSTFTTIAVFVPLVFMSGIAGAIFYDQAFAVTVGLMVSYFTGIMLLPVLYKLVYSIPEIKHSWINLKINNLIKAHTLDRFYDGGVDFIFRHKKPTLIFVAITLPLCAYLFYVIPKSRMPEIDQNELIMHIEWGENIHVDENRERVNSIFAEADKTGALYTAYIGQQQFLLNRDRELSVSEAELYFKTPKTDDIAPLQSSIQQKVKQAYPNAVVSFSPPETVFEKLFVTGEADIVAELYTRNKAEAPEAVTLRKLEKDIIANTGESPVGVAFDDQLNISIDRQKLLLYNVDYNEVYRILKTAFKENEVTTLRSYQQYLPITLAGKEQTINQVLENTLIRTTPENDKEKVQYIPLQSLVRVTQGEDLKTITAGKNGEYIPFSFYDVKNEEKLMNNIKASITDWDLDFSGSFFSNKQMLNELVVILFISILLMYFILAAQFESFLQPLIVLLEIPIDVAASLLVLWICGHTLNLMSAIGIVVTCGIIINDSILKLDAINELRKEGIPLMESIHEAGRRRLRPIIMTSLTTIFGMVPLLFSFDMGSELQKPLSIAMISAMFIGTAVSLFVIPLVYWFIYRKHA
ncbi:efflux RND transporter permease subunit [Parabacteroides bouchesdurhonensis]|uniref:efflux RND transporter permease subunit n=1 Tax=Parabacteroides bouchesdurhonensis TaxID=1936995 RepID=UPI000E4DDB71|nr:efflux RND transporter permease subunit [Parabacteroides bouchesdurhonensis]RHJ92997.1 AcrB/AcrD/AcrF family protein [Bacteroides sp. AM07-16]